MTTFKVTLIEQTEHTVELKSPSYFRLVTDFITEYYKVYQTTSGPTYDKITIIHGNPETYMKRYLVTSDTQMNKATSGTIITEREYRFRLMDLIETLQNEIEPPEEEEQESPEEKADRLENNRREDASMDRYYEGIMNQKGDR